MIKAPQYRQRNKPGKRLFKCEGGPWDGKEIPLHAVDGQICTTHFKVQTYNNGEVGRYVENTDSLSRTVVWEKKQ